MSDELFVIRNELGQYWTRQGEWVDGREPQRVMKLKHHDEAVNQLVELSAKDIALRGEIATTTLNDKGEPDVEASEHQTPTLADRAAAQKQHEKLLEEQQQLEEAANDEAEDEETESIAAV